MRNQLKARQKQRVWILIGVGVLTAILMIAVLFAFNRAGDVPNEKPVHDDELVVAVDEEQSTKSEEPIVDEPQESEIVEVGIDGYYIKVNRSQNVVMVYTSDGSGEYDKLMKTFVASTGAVDSETPLGVYTISDRYEALYLVGYVWGQYAVRIEGPYFFHSVPYFTKGEPDWNDLEYLEYNKLGEGASAGCVRLAARDAKWIYDNVPAGTMVEIYDSDVLPTGVVKPQAIKIDVDSPYRGWDPTDPNENNPWNKL